MKPSLSYRDDRDRCYGATGMAIGIVVVDGEKYLAKITLDPAQGEDMVEYTGDFFFSGNPAVSAKQSWNRTLQVYNLSMIAMLSNMLCRTLVLDGMPVSFDVKQMLHDAVAEEGRSGCSLDDDEIDRMFNKNYDSLFRIFSHNGVKAVARDFAEVLADRRTLSRLEILENLKALSML